MAGNIGALRTAITGMLGGNMSKMMSSRMPRSKMGSAMMKPTTKIKKAKSLSKISKVKSGSTTLTTPTIGGKY